MWGDKRYHTWNYHLRQTFGEKIFKLPLDAGFTCPNRDGSISRTGCIYCSSRGSGDFAGSADFDLYAQYEQTKEMMHKKWPNASYIAYFQAFTNTYAPVDQLRSLYEQALSFPGVVGLSIATRPDCLSDDILELLDEINQKTYLWVELGLQTIHNHTAELINRGHSYETFLAGLHKLQGKQIRTCVHVIYGLPHETADEMMQTAECVAQLPIQGIKVHLLHILRHTPLAEYYAAKQFPLMDSASYVKIVVDTLERLPKDVVVHRLTGDGPRDLLIAPTWSLKKWELLNAIDHELQRRSIEQGDKHSSLFP